MAEDIFSILFNGVNAVFDWFDSVVNATGMMPYVIGIVVLFIFFRLIIAPLFGAHISGGVGSDPVSIATADIVENGKNAPVPQSSLSKYNGSSPVASSFRSSAYDGLDNGKS